MLEKSETPGQSNMSGGVLYGDASEWGLAALLPGFESAAPLERRIVSNEVFALDSPDLVRGTSRYYKVTKKSLVARTGLVNLEFETGHDYSVLRARFDAWLAENAAAAGAVISCGNTAEGLVFEGGSVVGVRTSSEELKAKLVMDCSGVASKLVSEAGLRGELVPRQLYHAVKHVYKLEPALIESRFRVKPGVGRALYFMGSFMRGVAGGAFLYTNRETISVGVVAELDSLIRATTERFDELGRLQNLLDALVAHPMVAELLEGAELVERSSHNAPKGYKCILKRPYADGFLAAGDALGAFVKIGPMADGMRTAIATGGMAARAYLEAASSGSFRSRNLSRYRDMLTPVYEDVNKSGRDGFISESSFVYGALPKIIFGTRFLTQTFRSKPMPAADGGPASEADSKTGVVPLVGGKEVAHQRIKVDATLASQSVSKPWIPTCPSGCFALVTSKGTFTSFNELYKRNLAELLSGGKPASGSGRKAKRTSIEDIASGGVRFEGGGCVGCGTCGAIGPQQMVVFSHETEGHGVKYAYG